MQFLNNFGWLGVIIVLIAVTVFGYKYVLRIFGVVIIPEDSVGKVTKKFVLFGKEKTLPDGAIVAMKGEAGSQADTLAPGIHFFLWPWQYSISQEKFTKIEQGFVGFVEARDGKPLTGGRILCKKVDCDSFQSARQFLQSGGERGPQIVIIPPGTYRINTDVFSVEKVPVTEIPDNMVGIVTTKEGKPLKTGDIAGKEIPGHNSFQDAQTFIDNGGFKGMQEQVILSGRYFINPRFATVEIKDMSIVPIAHAGVIISYVGDPGNDVTGDDFKHGNLVKAGEKGVQIEPLDPGKYPVNPLTHKVESVSTANIVLNWADTKSEAHKLDENLSSITVRTSDGYTFNLDVSQIIHIPRADAPKVIARFGSVANLVTQVLEPTIGNYFRNAAQSSDVIDFLKNRQARQEEAKVAIFAVLKEYNVVAVDTLIGDIAPPAELMKTLTNRKLAEQEQITFEVQKQAEKTRSEFEQEKAMANTQKDVVTSQRQVAIQEFGAKAAIERAKGEAGAKRENAEADAKVLELVGNATAVKTLAIGTAEAAVIQKKTDAVGPGNFASIEIAKALATSGFKLVPDVVAGGGSGSDGGSSSGLMNVLIANMVLEQQRKNTETAPESPESEEAKKPGHVSEGAEVTNSEGEKSYQGMKRTDID